MSISRCAALVLLILPACADHAPPPYTMDLSDMPPEHRPIMRDAMRRWEEVAKRGKLFTEERQPGRDCGRVSVDMDPKDSSATTYGGMCNMRLAYRPDHAYRCVFLHELGHVLGLPDMDEDAPEGSVLRHCNGAVKDLTEREGEAVRELWGME